eukprot:408684-Rhodomonas_salina.1
MRGEKKVECLPSGSVLNAPGTTKTETVLAKTVCPHSARRQGSQCTTTHSKGRCIEGLRPCQGPRKNGPFGAEGKERGPRRKRGSVMERGSASSE